MTTLTTSVPAPNARGGLPRIYHMHMLGYQMDVHGSEHVAGLLERARYLCVEDVPKAASCATDAGDGGADIIIISTYSARKNAATRLFGNLGQLTAAKRKRPGMQTAAAGRLAQQMGEGIVKWVPWADIVFGTHNPNVLPTLFECVRHSSAITAGFEESLRVFPSTLPTCCEPSYAAWVSIAANCNNTCTFCIVSPPCGKQRDCRPGDVLAEAEAVATQGAIEMTLLGWNVSSYRVGFGDHSVFARLLWAAGSVEGIERIHFTSPHPAAFIDDVIEAMATTEAVMPSLHMPLQSGSDRVLRTMRHFYRTQRSLSILDEVRVIMLKAVTTTDIIVGFLDKTEEDFQAALDVVEQARFVSAYTSEHSLRPGTPTADRGDQVPTEVVKNRYRRLDAPMHRIAREENECQEGCIVEVLVTEGEGRRDVAIARISGCTADNHLIRVALPEELAEGGCAGGAPRPGGTVIVRVTHDAPHDLIADSAHYGCELDPCAVAANEALKPSGRLRFDDDPALLQVRCTRIGDAWGRRQAEACVTPELNTAPVSLGLPTLRVGAPIWLNHA